MGRPLRYATLPEWRRMVVMSDKKASKDMETVLVVVIAVFVAWIAVNHFRLVNARVEAAEAASAMQDARCGCRE